MKLSEINLSEKYEPNSTDPAERMDEIRNHMRAQLDYLCATAQRLNAFLDVLKKETDDSSHQSEQPDCD